MELNHRILLGNIPDAGCVDKWHNCSVKVRSVQGLWSNAQGVKGRDFFARKQRKHDIPTKTIRICRDLTAQLLRPRAKSVPELVCVLETQFLPTSAFVKGVAMY
jgi:hypothetical protein